MSAELRSELRALTEGLRGLVGWQDETALRWGGKLEGLVLRPDPWGEAAPAPAPRRPGRAPGARRARAAGGQRPTRRAAPSAPSAKTPRSAAPAAGQGSTRPGPEIDLAQAAQDPEGALRHLATQLDGCDRCKLHEGRSNVVFGIGAGRPRLLLVGEGPGQQEDLRGEPFVGPSGELLDAILGRGMGLRRGDVYILNIVKCRPPGNRDPQPDEIATCMPFLRAQVSILRPPAILALGRVATQSLLGSDAPLRELRGSWHSFAGIPVRATYHPAYLLRYPGRKRLAWQDVQAVMARLGLHRPGS